MSKIRESIANAMMVTGSFDRINGSKISPTYQALNQFSVRTSGSNIIQGQVNRIKVTEIMFPYAIPTIIDFADGVDATNNVLALLGVKESITAGVLTSTSFVLSINLPAGFYTGDEMATAIQAKLTAAGANWANLEVTWDDTNNRITFLNADVWDDGAGVQNFFYNIAPFVKGSLNPEIVLQQPELAWVIGYRSIAAQYPITAITNAAQTSVQFRSLGPQGPWLVPQGYPNAAGTSVPALPVFASGYAVSQIVMSPYTGRYTDFIDVVSHKLCGAQYVRDGNTNQNTVRRDIVARLYIADEISAQGNYEIGSRPFLIHRQFKSPKTMFWTVERSIDTIDLELYDMFGQPLPTGLGLQKIAGAASLVGSAGDYSISFQVEEGPSGEQSENVGYRF